MRIVLALDSLELGGTETQVARLAVELRGRGHGVTVLSLRPGGPLADVLDRAGIPREVVGGGLARALALPRRLRRLRPDVVHAFLLRPAALVLPAAVLAGVPRRVCGWRGLAPSGGPGGAARRALHVLVAACAHVQTANAEAVTASLPAAARARPWTVVRNGVDLPDAGTLDDPGAEPAHGVLIANLLAYKGHADLVRALASLPHPPPVDCYGDGPMRPELERRVAASGLDGVLRLRGARPRVASAYRSAQFALLVSHQEGLPNALLEAMAAGLPTVATAVGGVPELIEHEVTGLLVPAHDPPALAAAINRMATDPGLRRKLGGAARKRAAAFSWEACVRRHEDVYLGSGGG